MIYNADEKLKYFLIRYSINTENKKTLTLWKQKKIGS
jgi:hypothetical protein